MTDPNEDRSTGTAGGGSDVPGAEPDANAVPLAVAPGGMGSGSALPIVAPAALDNQGAADDSGPDGGGDPDRQAFNSGEDEVGGSGGPVGGTARP